MKLIDFFKNIDRLDVISCTTDEEILLLEKILDDFGFKWCSGKTYICESVTKLRIEAYKSNNIPIGFNVKNGQFSELKYYTESFREYNIIPFQKLANQFEEFYKYKKIEDL